MFVLEQSTASLTIAFSVQGQYHVVIFSLLSVLSKVVFCVRVALQSHPQTNFPASRRRTL